MTTTMWIHFWGTMFVLGALVLWHEWEKDHHE